MTRKKLNSQNYSLEVSYQTTKFWIYKTSVSGFASDDPAEITQPEIETSKISSLKFLELGHAKRLGYMFDRRKAARRNHRAGAAIFAHLPMADAIDSSEEGPSVLFIGITQNLSSEGIALTIPGIGFDKRYCRSAKIMKLSLLLPNVTIRLHVQPVHCAPLQQNAPRHGHSIGARITAFEGIDEGGWQDFVNRLGK
jgi:hypothetical protein